MNAFRILSKQLQKVSLKLQKIAQKTFKRDHPNVNWTGLIVLFKEIKKHLSLDSFKSNLLILTNANLRALKVKLLNRPETSDF